MLPLWVKQYFGRDMKHIVPGVFLAIGLATLFSLMSLGVMHLATGPLYRTSDAAACRNKYAGAKTFAETTTVDFLPYADSTRRPGLRCGFTRSVKIGDIK